MEINKKSTSKALFKNTGIIAIGQISTKIVNFFLLPLYTALLTTEEYGLVDLLITYAGLIAVIVGLQVFQAVFRFLVTIRENKKECATAISSIVLFTSLILIVYTVIFVLISKFITIKYSWFLLVYVVSNILLQTFSSIVRGLGDNTQYAFANFFSSAIIVVLNVFFIAILRLNIGWMLLSYCIGPVLGAVYLILKCKLWQYISFSLYDWKFVKKVLCNAIPLIPKELSWSVIHSSDRWVISMVLSYSANGLIAVASKFSTIYTTFFSVFNTSWTEQVILHYKDKGGAEYINEMFEKMICFFGCIAIGIISCMPFVFNLFVNQQFSDSYGLIPVYMIAVFFNAVIGLLSAIYLVNNETAQVAISTMVAAAINLIVDILLIKVVGIYAAPISSICGYMVISFWRLIDINKRHCKIYMSVNKVTLLVICLLTAMVGYYSKTFFIECITFGVVVIISLKLNWNFLLELFKTLLNTRK